MNPDERLDELETKAAFQDQAIEELGDALGKLQAEVDRLARSCRHLSERLDAGAALGGGEDPAGERPPHY